MITTVESLRANIAPEETPENGNAASAAESGGGSSKKSEKQNGDRNILAALSVFCHLMNNTETIAPGAGATQDSNNSADPSEIVAAVSQITVANEVHRDPAVAHEDGALNENYASVQDTATDNIAIAQNGEGAAGLLHEAGYMGDVNGAGGPESNPSQGTPVVTFRNPATQQSQGSYFKTGSGKKNDSAYTSSLASTGQSSLATQNQGGAMMRQRMNIGRIMLAEDSLSGISGGLRVKEALESISDTLENSKGFLAGMERLEEKNTKALDAEVNLFNNNQTRAMQLGVA